MWRRLIDLDHPKENGTAVVVRFQGRAVAVSRERLLELLATEGAVLSQALIATGDAGEITTEAHVPVVTIPPRRGNGSRVSHASLSTRIKKIHAYSGASCELRPTHAGFLSEVLAGFDWVLPEHPTTQLEQQLRELLTWQGVPADLAEQIAEFLQRYAAAKSA